MGDILGLPKTDIIKNVAAEKNIEVIDISLKPTSKDALKVLNEQEKQLKENIMKEIVNSKASDKETIRVLAFLINSFKRL